MGYIKHEDALEAIWRILNEMGISQKNNDRLVEEVDAVLDEYTVTDARPVVLCRDCKFSPIGDKDGSDLEWPFNEFDENLCPYKCLDNWYSHKPAPDFFCAAGENRGEKLVYDELIAELRQHHCDAKEDDTQEVCDECAYDVIIADESVPSGIASVCVCGLMNRAADAIEALTEENERLRKAVVRYEDELGILDTLPLVDQREAGEGE